MRTAVLLTTYNRPKLVTRAIQSVLAQTDSDVRLIVLDDGCNQDTRDAIAAAVGQVTWRWVGEVCGGATTTTADDRVTWWRGPQRTMAERKASISYATTLNIALNHLLRDERYVMPLCDDDALHPTSVRARADYLDAHPEAHVVYGRLRSVQFGADGSMNEWANSGAPRPLRADFPIPTGERVMQPSGTSWRTYFENGGTDPDTSKPYIEEGFWIPGPMRYGVHGSADHNQVAHRVECLKSCRVWPTKPNGDVEYWGEDIRYGVADAEFFRRLGEVHEFIGVDCWAVSKAYHGLSDGVSSAEVRE